MSSQSSKQSSRRHSSSKSKTKSDDWTDVTEPEERRRIQNRIAQRKFREKAREQREQAQRESQNREHAGSSYRVPEPQELAPPSEVECPGLPWGGVNMPYIIARGHESAGSQQGSRRTSDNNNNNNQRVEGASPPQVTSPLQQQQQQYLGNPFDDDGYGQVAGFDGRDAGSSGDERVYYEESPYFYDYENNGVGDASDLGYGHGYPS